MGFKKGNKHGKGRPKGSESEATTLLKSKSKRCGFITLFVIIILEHFFQ